MVPLTGYADRFSVVPGETIAFKVSSTASTPYQARLVRVICGDPNPAGPGMQEEDLSAVFAGTYSSRLQPVPLGSYARVASAAPLQGLTSFSLGATSGPPPRSSVSRVFLPGMTLSRAPAWHCVSMHRVPEPSSAWGTDRCGRLVLVNRYASAPGTGCGRPTTLLRRL